MYTEIFNTVPFLGITEMTRDSNNKKVDQLGKPIAPISRWQQYTTTKNTNNSPILGAIALDAFIGIDIDNSPMFNDIIGLLDNLAIHPTYVAVSMPVSANKGGHILFSKPATLSTTYEALVKLIPLLRKVKVDIQTGNKLIYLATAANKTKQLLTPELTSIDELIPMPSELLSYFITTVTFDMQTLLPISNIPETAYGFLLKYDLDPSIVNKLTPRKEYPTIHYMDDIPKGHATNWMLQVRKKLQVDKTVSADAFMKVLVYLNSLWSTQRGPSKQLHLDIERDINALAFVYDEEWEISGFKYPNYLLQTIVIYYEPVKCVFIQHNTVTDTVDIFTTQTQVINSILSTHKAHKKFKGEVLLKTALPVAMVDTPELAPRLTDNATMHKWFNLYTPSEGTHILQTMEKPLNYTEPVVTLAFMAHLIPDAANRDRFMRFLAYKHKSYEHTSLYFVLSGVGGAGKGLLVDFIIKYLAGSQRVMSENLAGLVNNFNEHFTTMDYLEIEEAGEGYTRRESEQLVAALKRLTGNKYLTIEGKGEKKTKVRHYITPIISANLKTKLITSTTSDDRRLVLLKSPRKLLDWINEDGFEFKHIKDTRDFVAALTHEAPNFAYFIGSLAKISHKDYTDNTNWKGTDYYSYIEDTQTYIDRLLQAAERYDLQAFINTLLDASVSEEDIDSLFSASLTGRPARALIYWTKQTKLLNILSLQEIAENSAGIDSNVKPVFRHLKQKRSYKLGDVAATIQVVEFTDPYIPYLILEPIDNEKIDI